MLMNKITLALCTALSLMPNMSFAAAAPKAAPAAPKNVIYMIGDGMGPAYLAAYRYYMDNPATKPVEKTIFDQLWVGVATTYPDDDTVVTDSAAGATALSTRQKSYNGAIAVDHQHAHLTTILEIAKAKGKATGVVATAQINHATPAAFVAHNKSRKNYDEIANDYFDNRVGGKFVADLMFGGGVSYFERKDRHLANEFKAAGYQYSNNWQDFNNITKLPALALLAPVGFPSTLDNPVQQPLVQMTDKALKLLSTQQNGFVVMIEGSQIDWCGHANDVACAMAEMHDFANAIKVAKAYVDQHPDTILVVTADHETGGLSLGAEGVYAWNSAVLHKVRKTAANLASTLVQADAKDWPQLWQDNTGLTLSKTEWAQLAARLKAAKPGFMAKNWQQEQDVLEAQAELLGPVSAEIKRLINHYSKTGWTSGAHTAIDVPVLAYGQQAAIFAGQQDNTDIATKLIKLIEQQ